MNALANYQTFSLQKQPYTKHFKALVKELITDKESLASSVVLYLDEIYAWRMKILASMQQDNTQAIKPLAQKNKKYNLLKKDFEDAIKVSEWVAEAVLAKQTTSIAADVSFSQQNKVINSLPIGVDVKSNLKKWYEYSLLMEFGIIAYLLIEEENIEIPKTKIEELSVFIRSNTQHYGAYAILLGIWQPTDYGVLTNQIRLVASIKQAEQGNVHKFSMQELKDMIGA